MLYFLRRPFWDARIDNLDCICCTSLCLHVIAALLYQNRAFTRDDAADSAGPASARARSLEIAMICVNALTLLAILGLFLVEFCERKLRSSAVRTLAKAVATLIVKLRRYIRGSRQLFLDALRAARHAPPELGVGCFVRHTKQGHGKVKDILLSDDGTKTFVILFSNGQRHHYSADSAKQKLKISASRFFNDDDPVPLSLFLNAASALPITVNQRSVEALFIILNVIEGKDPDHDAPVSKELVR